TALAAGSLLVTLALGLFAERLVADLFARHAWLGWAGVATVVILVGAVVLLLAREAVALGRLKQLDGLRHRAQAALDSDGLPEAGAVATALLAVYGDRPDLARGRAALREDLGSVFDGADMVRPVERRLVHPLDARARALISGSARRVALVTAVSPRALI